MTSNGPASDELQIGGMTLRPGQRQTIELPIAQLHTHTQVTMPVHVIRGKKPGPRIFVSAAIHGDEINGVEIIHRLLGLRALRRLRGTLIAVPIVNVFGFLQHERYLPDGRDLNRYFPGLSAGSLTSRLAHLFMEQIVANCTHGIDLHTGANQRCNLPQIRACLDDEPTAALARTFGAPVVLHANLRDGSLRQAVMERDIPMLLYETGEALRFDEAGIRIGVRGIVAVLRAIGMLPKRRQPARPPAVVTAYQSTWVRASQSGILRTQTPLGRRVEKGQAMGTISDPFGEQEVSVESTSTGIIIGRSQMPLVNEGDAMFHIAQTDAEPGESMERLQIEPDPDLDRRDHQHMDQL
jgi:predicted deacylase